MRYTHLIMKYISIGLVVVFIGLVVYVVIKKSPSNIPVVDTNALQDDASENLPTDMLLGEQAPVQTSVPVETKKSNTRVVDNMTIETTKEGSGPAITNGQTAVVDYVGKLQDGTVFDASKNHGGTFEFKLGAGMVIKGWDEGVLGMKVGESRTLTIPPELAYGANGIPGAISPNATLVFDVTLEAIK